MCNASRTKNGGNSFFKKREFSFSQKSKVTKRGGNVGMHEVALEKHPPAILPLRPRREIPPGVMFFYRLSLPPPPSLE